MSGPIKIGSVIADKYRVERVLGRGGMGLVIAATHLELHELRAIKLIRPDRVGHLDVLDRFMREARAAARLKSQHVAKVFDVGRLDDSAPYMVMEYLEGCDLSALRQSGSPLPIADVALYVIQICEALAEAHAMGLVHRDLKPGNLFLTYDAGGSPCVKVLDFGVSKVLLPDKSGKELTSTGRILGTPVYMPPEQMRGQRDLDARADIWALGAVAYVLLTDSFPFDATNPVEIIAKVLDTDEVPVHPSNRRLDVPRELGDVLLRCLARNREERIANAAELARAFEPFAPESARFEVQRIQRTVENALSAPPQSSVNIVAPPAVVAPTPTWTGATLYPSSISTPRLRVPLVLGSAAVVVVLGSLLGLLALSGRRIRHEEPLSARPESTQAPSAASAPSAGNVASLAEAPAASSASAAAASSPAAPSSPARPAGTTPPPKVPQRPIGPRPHEGDPTPNRHTF